MTTSQVSYYVWKTHNLQTIETPNQAKTLLELYFNTLNLSWKKC